LIDAQVKKPATVLKLTNQLKTFVAPEDKFMNDNNAKRQQVRTATIGRPFLVVYENSFGACPRIERPYRMREEQNRNEFPAENAEVKMAAFTIEGRALIPARCMAITYGEAVAVPPPFRSSSSSDGTNKPEMMMPRM